MTRRCAAAPSPCSDTPSPKCFSDSRRTPPELQRPAILGTALIASGTAALNQWYEREADQKMRRTADRPLPSGRLDATHALWFAIALSVIGFFDLYFGANP